MAITIQTYSISTDLKEMSLKFEMNSTDTIYSILLWNEDNYKDSSRSTDLTSLALGSTNTEDLTISASDAGLTSFTGLYVVEIKTVAGDAVMAGASDFTQYYKVAAQFIANIDMSCLSCNDEFQNALLLDLYLQATVNSLLLGRYQDAISHLKNLKVIEGECSSCSDCSDIEMSVSTAGNIVSVGIIDCQLTNSI